MADNWKAYLCTVNFKLASIRVNLRLRDDKSLSKKWLLWIWLYFQSPRADGLSDRNEAPKLWEIEDALVPKLSDTCGALLCGAITTEGRREFYFYADSALEFEKSVAEILRQFSPYKYDYNSQEDPSWDQYLNVLYPSPEQLERIGNQELLDHLLTQGDNPLIEREIRHWMYFPSAELRHAFKQALDSPFEVDHEYDEDNGNPFALVIKRIQSLQQPQIDDTVIELFRLAEKFQGNYTGWETPVTSE